MSELVGFFLLTCAVHAGPDAPCAGLAARFVCGDVRDADAVFEFGRGLDVVTIEVEDVSVAGLERLEAAGARVVPRPAHIGLIQDKGLQKEFFAAHDVPTADFVLCGSDASGDLAAAAAKVGGFPVVQKLRRGGYDGRGVRVVEAADDPRRFIATGSSSSDTTNDSSSCADQGDTTRLLVERKVAILKEVSVIVARRGPDDVAAYAPVETVFDARANVALYVSSPADLDADVAARCTAVAVDLVEKLDFVGLLAVELFVVDDAARTVLVNEVAPRCHNTGHHTIEANATSQFAMLVRVALDLPLGSTAPVRPHAATLNLLGDAATPNGQPVYRGLDAALADPDAYPHLYGKATVSPFRKMGHLTVCGDDRDTVAANVLKLLDTVGVHAAADARASASTPPA